MFFDDEPMGGATDDGGMSTEDTGTEQKEEGSASSEM